MSTPMQKLIKEGRIRGLSLACCSKFLFQSGGNNSKYAAVDSMYLDTETCLLDLDKLAIPARDQVWLKTVNKEVRALLNKGAEDSRDYCHAVRVVSMAHSIWLYEKDSKWAHNIDPLVVITAALVHDLAIDKININVNTNALSPTDKRHHHRDTIRDFLDALHCPPAVAGPASHIASFVPSAIAEATNPAKFQTECNDYPALKIVHDADRLDVLAPPGMSRKIKADASKVFNTVSMLAVIKAIDDKFALYPGLMQTKTGAKMGENCMRWVRTYRKALVDEVNREAEEAEAEVESVL